MTAQPRSFYSFDDYLEGERADERECRAKVELHRGED
jgi:hypothetical protein